MAKKCLGCGAILQDNNVLLEGFTNLLTNDYCTRCFRMKNYGEYQMVTKSNDEFIDNLKAIGKTNSLVLYVVDLLNVPNNLKEVKKYLVNNDIILVLNKRDALPLSIVDEKLIAYFEEQNLGFFDIILISALKDYNLDLLYSKIKKHNSKNIYVVGNTNAGKSMLINKFMKNYMAKDETLSISAMPSTTLKEIKIEIGDFYLIDTPGLVDNRSIVNYVDQSMLKKISPKDEIKPKIFKIRKNQSILIEDIVRIDYIEGEKNAIVIFASNELKMKKINSSRHKDLENLFRNCVNVKYKEDVVISGLGFLKINDECQLNILANKEVEIFTRKNMI